MHSLPDELLYHEVGQFLNYLDSSIVIRVNKHFQIIFTPIMERNKASLVTKVNLCDKSWNFHLYDASSSNWTKMNSLPRLGPQIEIKRPSRQTVSWIFNTKHYDDGKPLTQWEQCVSQHYPRSRIIHIDGEGHIVDGLLRLIIVKARIRDVYSLLLYWKQNNASIYGQPIYCSTIERNARNVCTYINPTGTVVTLP